MACFGGAGPPIYEVSVAAVLDNSPVADLLNATLDVYADLLGVDCPFQKAEAVFIPGYGSKARATPAPKPAELCGPASSTRRPTTAA